MGWSQAAVNKRTLRKIAALESVPPTPRTRALVARLRAQVGVLDSETQKAVLALIGEAVAGAAKAPRK